MELNKIDIILEKYFNGETTLIEEQDLRTYFLTQNVPLHLQKYTSLFAYFDTDKEQKFTAKLPMEYQNNAKKRNRLWLSIAASVVVALGVGSYAFFNTNTTPPQSDLGTYDDPKLAFEATQKALSLLSNNVNVGIESVLYIEEYQIAKNKVFKKPARKQGS